MAALRANSASDTGWKLALSGRGRIDRDDPVAPFVQRSGHPTIAAPDVEHAGWAR